MNVLISRTDAIGDVVQSLCGLASLKEAHPDVSIDYLVSTRTAPVLADNPCVDRVHFIERATPGMLRERGYGAAVVMYYRAPVGRLLKAAAVPVRIGPLSKLSSWWYLNRGVRQNRSRSIKNEAEYNTDLLRALWPEVRPRRPEIFTPGRDPGAALPERFVVVAPQSRGSAPNLDHDLYCRIVETVVKKRAVVLTGTSETALTGELAGLDGRVVSLCGRTTLDDLIWVLRRADAVIAPSTGTVHLANALDRPLFSFYPDRGPMSAWRWAPYGCRGAVLLGAHRRGSGILYIPEEKIVRRLEKFMEEYL